MMRIESYKYGLIAGLVLGLLVALLPALFYTSQDLIEKNAGFKGLAQEKSTPEFYAYTPSGLIRQIVPLDEPVLSQAGLMSWISQAVTETMTFNHEDHMERFRNASRHFTKPGWASLVEYLKDQQIMELILPLQTGVSATPSAAPIFRESGIIGGRYKTVIAMPVRLTLEDGTHYKDVTYVVSLRRAADHAASSGMRIENWAVE